MAEEGPSDALARAESLGGGGLTPEQRHAELQKLTAYPQPTPQTHAVNVAIGVVDELGRLVLSFVLVAVVLIVLAAILTPWLWIAVAAWLGAAIWTIASFLRRRKDARPRHQVLDP